MPLSQGVNSTGQVTAVAVDETLANAAGAAPMSVSIAGGAVGGATVAQGDKTADATNAWPVRLYNATVALLGRAAAGASLPVALSTEDAAKVPSLGSAAMAASTPVTIATDDTQFAALLAAMRQLAGFETLTLIDYSGGDQTLITDGSNGIWIKTAGDLKFDTWAGVSGVTLPVEVGLFPQRRIKKIYQTGSTAGGYIGYPPS